VLKYFERRSILKLIRIFSIRLKNRQNIGRSKIEKLESCISVSIIFTIQIFIFNDPDHILQPSWSTNSCFDINDFRILNDISKFENIIEQDWILYGYNIRINLFSNASSYASIHGWRYNQWYYSLSKHLKSNMVLISSWLIFCCICSFDNNFRSCFFWWLY
jgi:hypothetical protein